MSDDKFETITCSELIDIIAAKQQRLSPGDIKHAVKGSFDYMGRALSAGKRIEIRGFGSFSLHQHKAKTVHNLRTTRPVKIPSRHIPHFKPSKMLSEKINGASETPLKN